MFLSSKIFISCEKLLVEALYVTCVMWLNAWKQTQVWITTVSVSLKDKWTVLSLLEDKQNCKFGGVVSRHPGWSSALWILVGIVREDNEKTKEKYEGDKQW